MLDIIATPPLAASLLLYKHQRQVQEREAMAEEEEKAAGDGVTVIWPIIKKQQRNWARIGSLL